MELVINSGQALLMAWGMLWKILWPLVLGFALSGMIQAVVSHQARRRRWAVTRRRI